MTHTTSLTSHLRRFLLLFLLASFAAGCAMPAAISLPVAILPATATPTAQVDLVQAPADATATPTPFQPLPPTAVYLPTDTPLPTATLLPPTPTPLPTEAPRKHVKQPGHQINILLLGSDQRPWDRYFRTDTIILATLNSDLGTVNLTSFPRDLYVTIPGRGQERINTAWEYGGFKLLADTFQYNFGFTPDHYVVVSFSSFKQVIDSLGGLDVHVATAVSDYRAGYYVTIPAGVVHMDADDVLWYVRTRKTTSDFARAKRQHEVMIAIFDKMLSLNAIKRAPQFYNIYKENVVTDLSFTDFLSLLPLATKLTDASHIKHYYIGPQETYDYITYGGGMVLMPRPDAIQQVLRKALNQ